MTQNQPRTEILHKIQTGGGTSTLKKEKNNEKKPPAKKQKTSAENIKKMQGWWVKYAEKSRIEKEKQIFLKRSNCKSVGRLSESEVELPGSNSDHLILLESSTTRRPSELGDQRLYNGQD